MRALSFRPTPPDNVVLTFRVDAIAQEPNETLSLELVPIVTTLPTGDGVFFRNTLTMSIIDSDSKGLLNILAHIHFFHEYIVVGIYFTEDDFLAIEQDLIMSVTVTKDLRIATPVVLDVIPLTVSEAENHMPPPLPENVPQNNSFSPPFAGNSISFTTQLVTACVLNRIAYCIHSDLVDFNNTVIRITFFPDENVFNDVNVPIAIVDDPVNEATEQVFIVQLQLISSVNPGLVDLTTRQASLCRIVDDDRKWNSVVVHVSILRSSNVYMLSFVVYKFCIL